MFTEWLLFTWFLPVDRSLGRASQLILRGFPFLLILETLLSHVNKHEITYWWEESSSLPAFPIIPGKAILDPTAAVKLDQTKSTEQPGRRTARNNKRLFDATKFCCGLLYSKSQSIKAIAFSLGKMLVTIYNVIL